MGQQFTLEEARAGARLVIENARRLEGAAEVLAREEEYGPAVALLVLAAEEAVKAFFLSMHLVKTEYPPEDVHQILRTHQVRHDIAALRSLVPGLAEDALEEEVATRSGELEKWEDKEVDPENPDEDRMRAIASLLRDSVSGLWDRAQNAMSDLEPGPESAAEAEWWEKANYLKMRGLYVDPSQEDGWDTPSDLDEDDYRQAAKYVKPFIEAAADDVDVMESITGQGLENFRRIMELAFGPDFEELPEGMQLDSTGDTS